MTELFICEDNPAIAKQITAHAANVIEENQLDFSIKLTTSNPTTLLNIVKSSKEPGVYFLDIDLGSNVMNGLELAQKIRELDPRGFIIFITSDTEKFQHTFKYKIEALDYIVKQDTDNLERRLLECLTTIISRNPSSNEQSQFSIKDGTRIITEKYKNILFFEVSSKVHKIKMHSLTKQAEFYGSLKNVETELLKHNFFRCHQSYLINLTNVKEVDVKNRFVYMINGQKCEVSYRALTELKKMMKQN
ncbi:LytR/AlgR family response regulator transcription factor [Carnobacterium divergens]|uniref:LytR/AlgR family response regulator transcription factor n=1 Tax=Carnobacterium divergens TaxID=2748 RepID=UPI0039C97895